MPFKKFGSGQLLKPTEEEQQSLRKTAQQIQRESDPDDVEVRYGIDEREGRERE